MQQLKFSIKTLSPVVISSMSNSTVMTTVHSEISGSIIRGILASRYVQQLKLEDKAHEDAKFIRLFYGGLKFLTANLVVKGQRSFILPLSLQQAKSGSGSNKVQDLLTTKETEKGYKSLQGYGIIEDGKIYTAEVNKNISMHMSRDSEGERLSGKSTDGKIFNYESIDEGQVFQGLIVGDKANLQKLVDGLKFENNSMIAYIGRSHFTQYGKCQITFEKIEDVTIPNIKKEEAKIFLRLDTPLIPMSEFFISAEKLLTEEVVDILNDVCGKKIFSLDKIFSAGMEIENFVNSWSMKRPRVMALAAGSVFALNVDSKIVSNDDIKIISEKIFQGFGERTEEGFGQLRVWKSEDFVKAKSDELQAKGKSKIQKDSTIDINLSENTKKMAKLILEKHFLDQIRIYAHDDAENLRPQLRRKNLTHFFARLDGLLSDVQSKSNLQESFQNYLNEEIRNGTLFDDHLKNTYVTEGHRLYDVLTGQAELPYKKRNLIEDLTNAAKKEPEEAAKDKEKFKNLLAKLGINDFDYMSDKFYLEYFKNYFRFARKIAADERGGTDE